MAHVNVKTVAIVGRANTGKSALFNRLVGKDEALVAGKAGTTRDWKSGIVPWRDTKFTMIDTGGLEKPPPKKIPEDSEAALDHAIAKQAWTQAKQADALLLVVDGRDGLLEGDRTIARAVQKLKKPVFLLVNKMEKTRNRSNAQEFWKLGLDEPWIVSARTGSGVGDVLDAVYALHHPAPPTLDKHDEQIATNIAIIGKPNVGKSSLINALLGEQRVIVSPIAGTTRESIDVAFQIDNTPYRLIDTAGVRRKQTHADKLERSGVDRTTRTLRRTDIALFVINANEPLASQDLRLARTLIDSKAGVIVIANKWDLARDAEKDEMIAIRQEAAQKLTKALHAQAPHISWAPILFCSAMNKRGIPQLLKVIIEVNHERNKVIADDQLEDWLKKMTYRGISGHESNKPYLYGLRQTGTRPPEFTITAEIKKLPTRAGKQKGTVRDSYVKFLERRLRETFGFAGTPILVAVRGIKQLAKR
jgi:GTPase